MKSSHSRCSCIIAAFLRHIFSLDSQRLAIWTCLTYVTPFFYLFFIWWLDSNKDSPLNLTFLCKSFDSISSQFCSFQNKHAIPHLSAFVSLLFSSITWCMTLTSCQGPWRRVPRYHGAPRGMWCYETDWQIRSDMHSPRKPNVWNQIKPSVSPFFCHYLSITCRSRSSGIIMVFITRSQRFCYFQSSLICLYGLYSSDIDVESTNVTSYWVWIEW
jgi:hypothetical protein